MTQTLWIPKHQGIDVSSDAVAFVLGYTNAQRKAKEKSNTSLMITPTFTVVNQSKAEPIMAEFVKRTRTEAGCLYYGWSLRGDKLVCEEIYEDSTAVLAHCANVGPLLAEFTAEGVGDHVYRFMNNVIVNRFCN